MHFAINIFEYEIEDLSSPEVDQARGEIYLQVCTEIFYTKPTLTSTIKNVKLYIEINHTSCYGVFK